MLFHVSMSIKIPHDIAQERVEKLKILEHQRATQLEAERKWIYVWRVAGKWANISIFDVEDPSELHEILSSLPLFPFMETDVTPICPMNTGNEIK
jgi:muconolactone D-isomerase